MEPTVIWALLRQPVSWVGRKLATAAGAWTIEPIFRQSHDYYVALRRWQQRWKELADGLEYKLHTRSDFNEDDNAEQTIWLRNAGTCTIDELHCCVEAKLGKFSYQVPLTATRLKPGHVVSLPLTGLPRQNLFIHADRIIATYESIHAYPLRILRNRQIEFYAQEGLGAHPTHNDYLNGKWKRWNGRLYSVKAIADARDDRLMHLAHSLCWRYGLFGMDVTAMLRNVLRTRRYRRLPGVLMFALVASRPVLGTIVWTRLLLRKERLAFTCDPGMLAATEHVMGKGKSARPVRIVELDDDKHSH